MTEHISDEYFVTREVVTYNGSALVSGEKDLVVEECYQLVVNGRGAGEITCSPWDKKEAFLGYLYLRGYISGAGDVRTKKLRQIVTAVADGANSVTSIVEYLKTL